MSSSLHITNETVGAHRVLALTGDLDVAGAPLLRQRVTELAVGPTTADGVVIDLDGVDTIDDVGLGALLGAAWRVRARGGRIALVASSPRITDVLRVSGLDRAVDLHPSLAEAVAATA